MEWEYAYREAPNPVPWLHPRRGKQGGAFFQSVQDNLEIHGFAVNALAEGPGVIIALFDIGATVKRTGKRIVARDEAQVWHFNEAGKAARFRHCDDAYQQAMDCKI